MYTIFYRTKRTGILNVVEDKSYGFSLKNKTFFVLTADLIYLERLRPIRHEEIPLKIWSHLVHFSLKQNQDNIHNQCNKIWGFTQLPHSGNVWSFDGLKKKI